MKPALLVPAVLSTLLLTQCAVPAGAGSSSLPPATKENPFVNSLGMKFVPVPGTNILMCITETTVAQYKAGRSYKPPKFPQGDDHPAMQLTWRDAKAWCGWLSKKEGRKYRLPTDAEWSAAVGISMYPWGNSWPPPNNAGNYAGQEMRDCTEAERVNLFRDFGLIGGFSDRHKFTSPVGSYPANRLGLHDLGGNVWEWCEDWSPHGQYHIMRGGAWHDGLRDHYLASANRYDIYSADNVKLITLLSCGFRCVLAL